MDYPLGYVIEHLLGYTMIHQVVYVMDQTVGVRFNGDVVGNKKYQELRRIIYATVGTCYDGVSLGMPYGLSVGVGYNEDVIGNKKHLILWNSWICTPHI